MRFSMPLALSLSVLLVGGATFYRFADAGVKTANLSVVNNSINTMEDNPAFDAAVLTPATTSAAKLTDTDLISRQLLSDFLNLSVSGQATDANILDITTKQVENIGYITTGSSITSSKLKIVPDTELSFKTYSDTVTNIYTSYQSRLNAARGDGENLNVLGPKLYLFARTASIIYGDTATKLLNVSVPASLATSHLKLINNYYSSAGAMSAIANSEKDPTDAFASLISLNKSVNAEPQILTDIGNILAPHGL